MCFKINKFTLKKQNKTRKKGKKERGKKEKKEIRKMSHKINNVIIVGVGQAF